METNCFMDLHMEQMDQTDVARLMKEGYRNICRVDQHIWYGQRGQIAALQLK